MSDIHSVIFPLSIGFGARGGPSRITEIVTAITGHENRNSPAAHSRRRYDVGAGIKSLDDLHLLIGFFEARFGQLYGFLFKDPVDHKSAMPSEEITPTDQIIATADGETVRFDLTKTYGDSAASYPRPIRFIDSLTLRVAVDGVETAITYDADNGQIVFAAAPAVGATITAGFSFFVPVRFDTARLDISLEAFGAGQAVSVPLIEVIPYG